MFDNSYPFTKLFSKDLGGKNHLKSKITYVFKIDNGESYLIEVEEYGHNIYIIKFCPKKLKRHPKRFNILTKENKMPQIVATCVQVMLQTLKKNPLANFGFLGSNTIDFSKRYVESKCETKRYRIYRYVMMNYLNEETFSHHMDSKNSTYLAINNKNENKDEILVKANKMFESLFPMLTDI